jgi:hypothetical protein
LQNKKPTASDRIKSRARQHYERLVQHYLKQMDKRLPMGIHEPDDVSIAGISEFDGTAGFDPRPDFVKKDDDEWAKS